MQHIMDGMIERRCVVRLSQQSRDEVATCQLTSLCDLGYCNVGLDDNWQACEGGGGGGDTTRSAAAPGMHYHDIEGKPMVNLTLFPSLRNMTDYAHSLNLTAGFYGNNCICHDHCRNESECDMQIKSDVKSFIEWGFDSWKLDGCGGQNNMTLFDNYLRELSPNNKPIVVESCHFGKPPYDPNPSLPPREGCPFNFYRSSGDIQPSYPSVLRNLASVERYRAINASVPGCWAYPDMLQIGVRHHSRKEDGMLLLGDVIGLTKAESRTHFGAWCIVSSPLTLGHDVHDKEVNDHIWEIISNREAIAVNQAYDGDSGGVYYTSTTMICIMPWTGNECNHTSLAMDTSSRNLEGTITVPSYRYLSKPLGGGRVAALLINSKEEADNLTAKFADIPGLSCSTNYTVRNIWTHSDEGTHKSSWSTMVGGHDAAFITVGCASGDYSTETKSKAPLRVFVLAGQSNMVGHGWISGTDSNGQERNATLEWLVRNDPLEFGMLKQQQPKSSENEADATKDNQKSKWTAREDVRIACNSWEMNDSQPVITSHGNLYPGLCAGDPGQNNQLGPELGFGWTVGDAFFNPRKTDDSKRILLIKVAWGGKSLAVDFRPPSSAGVTGPYYNSMVATVKSTLQNITHYFPEDAAGRPVHLSGFAWHQGWNDGCNITMTREYERNLANLIRDIRKDLDTPLLPFAIATTGMVKRDGNETDAKLGKDRRQIIIKAELAVAKYKEFEGNVASLDTRPFERPKAPASPTDQNYHWMGNAESYWLVGKGLGEVMVDLVILRERNEENKAENTTKKKKYLHIALWIFISATVISTLARVGCLWYFRAAILKVWNKIFHHTSDGGISEPLIDHSSVEATETNSGHVI